MTQTLTDLERACLGEYVPDWEVPRGYLLGELLTVLRTIYEGETPARAFTAIRGKSSWYAFKRRKGSVEWLDRFDQAESLFRAGHLRNLHQSAAMEPRHSQWLLERRFPEDFSPRQQIDVVNQRAQARELLVFLRDNISTPAFEEVKDALVRYLGERGAESVDIAETSTKLLPDT